MVIRVFRVFRINFREKNTPRSSRLVWGYPEPRLVWVENGVSCQALSRLEGIETKVDNY